MDFVLILLAIICILSGMIWVVQAVAKRIKRRKKDEVYTIGGGMEIKHKKLIAREILWFAGIFVVSFIFKMETQVGYKENWTDFLWAFFILYLLRAIVWAIKTLRKKD